MTGKFAAAVPSRISTSMSTGSPGPAGVSRSSTKATALAGRAVSSSSARNRGVMIGR